METLNQQHKSDEHEEGQGQDLQRGLFLNKLAYGVGHQEHNDHGDNHRSNHDLNLIAQPNSREDGVKGEDQINQDNLDDNARGHSALGCFGLGRG